MRESATGVVSHVYRVPSRGPGPLGTVTRSDAVTQAITQIGTGQAVIVVDDTGAGCEGAVVFAAATATTELVAFAVRHTAGYLCAPMTAAECSRLELPLMPNADDSEQGPAYTVTVDARHDVTTGISAVDRAHTLRLLANPASSPRDLTRPGHVAPLRTDDRGVLARPGIGEAALDLVRLAGLPSVAAFGHVVSPINGEMASYEELTTFAAEYGLVCVGIRELVAYRRKSEKQVSRSSETPVPTPFGNCRSISFRSLLDGIEHVAIVYGDIGTGVEVVTSIHVECVTGDVFGSLRCRCRSSLDAAHRSIATAGRGVVIYLRDQRGHSAARLDEQRDVAMVTVAQMLRDLGVRSVRLVATGPVDEWELAAHGIETVERLPLSTPPEHCQAGSSLARAVQ